MSPLLPCPHGDKLTALLVNEKLPDSDRPRVGEAIERYRAWIEALGGIRGPVEDRVTGMVSLLDDYKRYIDVELIFDSRENFLYRQKGQIKLDNTIVEEFIPHLMTAVFGDDLQDLGLIVGPANCFSHLRFDSDLRNTSAGGGMAIRSKDQDFAIARRLFLRASHSADFADSHDQETRLAYVAAEIKTNLDKTMFQEAAATAYDLKLSVPNAKYFLLCEWLDMTPISTSVTAIEEVLILRKAKRMSSSTRSSFSSVEGRAAAREDFERFLREHPFSPDAFLRFVRRVEVLLVGRDEDEGEVLGRGWF